MIVAESVGAEGVCDGGDAFRIEQNGTAKARPLFEQRFNLFGPLAEFFDHGDTCQLESSGKLDASGEPYRYYNCRRFCRSGKEACAGYRIATAVLESAILSHIAQHVFTEDRCHEILRDFVDDQGVLRQKTAEQRRLLERERDELGKRLERWYERIEIEPDLGEVGAERLRELKAKRDEVLRTLAKLKPLHSVPPYLYKPETIHRFQGRLRDAFLSGDRATARVYLQNLFDHIVVSEDEIVIEARAGAALAMMAGAPASRSEATAGEVLANVVDCAPGKNRTCDLGFRKFRLCA
ncbi:MAG: hypothetical protein ABIQ16_02760 [Polyangiaceae bacterium]